ncbi:hypothetical protein [Effusibacillus pohliae]|uniref:hypothetical protein n=1 Tax=Effusibacillus pohliae TaxID=232270 RepID=UPI000371F519|nr:hypothetical protein [Effusibacillus pohliae]
MPRLLKREAVRLFESSIESVNLALMGLGFPTRIQMRESVAQYAPHIGLIGAAAELALSGCLVQAYGAKTLLLESGQFKSARTILDDFRKMLKNPVPRTNFLIQGTQNHDNHRQKLYQATLKFGPLITARAGGFHAGRAPTRDVCIAMAKEVIDFLGLLSESTRMRSYIQNIPSVPEIVKDRQIILEDLARRLATATDSSEKAVLLSSIYLVLPEVPENEPDWLAAMERVAIAPKENDLSYLLNVLERSNVGTLLRVSKTHGGQSIPVVVNPLDENALPIQPQFFRRSFNSAAEQFHSDVASSNGRLNSGVLDVPPIEFVYELFVFGFERLRIESNGSAMFTAHQIWPFVLSSLSVSSTEGPVWFLVRRTDDLNQLRAYVERAARISTKTVRNRKVEFLKGLQAIQAGTHLQSEFVEIIRDAAEAEEKRENLKMVVERNQGDPRQLPECAQMTVTRISDGDESLTPLLVAISKGEIELNEVAKKYWTRILSEAATDEEDLPGLLTVLQNEELSQAHTAVRKAFRRIDFLSNGPVVDS